MAQLSSSKKAFSKARPTVAHHRYSAVSWYYFFQFSPNLLEPFVGRLESSF